MDNPFHKKSFFDILSSKQAFILGCVSSVLVLGTVGCVVLGIYVWQSGNAGRSESNIAATNTAANSNTAANTATPNTPAATSEISGTLAAVSASDHVWGEGQLTLIVYSDFQCPYCKRFDDTLRQVMENYSGKVRNVFRHFPLSFHDEAENAAEAAECAGEQNKFWEYAEGLFENQKTLGEETYTKLASDLKLNTTTFASCRSSDKMLAAIKEDQDTASAVGVRGTPASFLIDKNSQVKKINGGAVSYTALKGLLDQELAK